MQTKQFSYLSYSSPLICFVSMKDGHFSSILICFDLKTIKGQSSWSYLPSHGISYEYSKQLFLHAS